MHIKGFYFFITLCFTRTKIEKTSWNTLNKKSSWTPCLGNRNIDPQEDGTLFAAWCGGKYGRYLPTTCLLLEIQNSSLEKKHEAFRLPITCLLVMTLLAATLLPMMVDAQSLHGCTALTIPTK